VGSAVIINSSHHYRLSDGNHTLTINGVEPGDERRYGCQATNTDGATELLYQQVRVAGQ